MNQENLKSHLQELEAVILSSPQNESLRVLERTARIVCDISQESPISEDEFARLQTALSPSLDPEIRLPRIKVHLPYEAITISSVSRALVALAEVFGPAARPQIIIYSGHPLSNLLPVLRLGGTLREMLQQPNNVAISLVAPFAECNEAEMPQLFDLGVRVNFAAGWTPNFAINEIPPLDKKVLRSFAEFGYRASITWYVHAGNIDAFEEQIPDLLTDNFNSGFSLPLVSQNPYYQFKPGFPALPDALEYCQLLARCYDQYPYYDDIFFPLNDLAMLIREGSWQSNFKIPSTINFAIDAEGRIALFRQSPALAAQWSTVLEIADTPMGVLQERLVKFTRDTWCEKPAYCSGCCWQNICGGLDAASRKFARHEDLDAMCGYRKLFLQHFGSLRAPDYVFGRSKKKAPLSGIPA